MFLLGWTKELTLLKQISSLDQMPDRAVQGHRGSSHIVHRLSHTKICLCYDFRRIPDHLLIYCCTVYGIGPPGICPRRGMLPLYLYYHYWNSPGKTQVLLTTQVSKITVASFLERRPQEHCCLSSSLSYLCLLDQCLILNKHQFLLNGLINRIVVDARVPDYQDWALWFPLCSLLSSSLWGKPAAILWGYSSNSVQSCMWSWLVCLGWLSTERSPLWFLARAHAPVYGFNPQLRCVGEITHWCFPLTSMSLPCSISLPLSLKNK